MRIKGFLFLACGFVCLLLVLGYRFLYIKNTPLTVKVLSKVSILDLSKVDVQKIKNLFLDNSLVLDGIENKNWIFENKIKKVTITFVEQPQDFFRIARQLNGATVFLTASKLDLKQNELTIDIFVNGEKSAWAGIDNDLLSQYISIQLVKSKISLLSKDREMTAVDIISKNTDVLMSRMLSLRDFPIVAKIK